ncbi:uncharacterized protein EAE97_009382 [Botrytis byssoidea]|uniref:Uncharacterized protein n=1 Tax=Botrytis byssoidea TaxID=139641 RepID=A0A9P5I6N8_9HELO|nr:uncharacterized protein EAE97_009382 [Botrytis byssoidea]KAF7931173.1 hypothetical protein EAE97_009382 [Botrytis byssoidea]
MSYNHNGGDDICWYNNQQVSHPIAISTSNDVTEGVKATASTETSSTNPTPTKFQAEWPYDNSQQVEGPSQGWYPSSGLCQNTAVLPQMPRSPHQYSSNVDNFDTRVNGELPNMTGLEIHPTPDEILYNPSLQNAFGSGNSSISQQDTPMGEFFEEYNMDSTTTGFRTPVPSRYQINSMDSTGTGFRTPVPSRYQINSMDSTTTGSRTPVPSNYQTNNNLSVGSDTPAGLQSSVQVDNPPFDTRTQFASSTQDGEASQQESSSQGGKYQAGFFNETMTAQLNRPLSAPPAGHWIFEQELSCTGTGLDIPLPLNPLSRATPRTVPLAYSGNWQYDGSSKGPAIDSDIPTLQPYDDIRNDPSGTLVQDAGARQGAQPRQQVTQNDGLGQNTSANIPVPCQQSDISSTRSPITSDRRRHSDPVSTSLRDARESQKRVRVPSQLSEQAAQYEAPSINTSRAPQQSGALIEDALGAIGSRRLGDTSPIPAQELHDTNPSPTGFRTESWRMRQKQAESQTNRVAQQPSERRVTVPAFDSSYPGGEPHVTFVHPERSHQNTFQQPVKQRKSASFSSGSARLREIARPPMQPLASAPPAVTTQQQFTRRDRQPRQPRQPDRQSAQSGTPYTQQSPRIRRRRTHRVQLAPQPRIPKNRFDRDLPSRLNAKAAAFANVEPAEDFLKALTKMPFLDKVACVDRLMREDIFKDYMKPHLFQEYDTGRNDGLKFELERRTKDPMLVFIETGEIKDERRSLEKKTKFDDMQIEIERRRRELAARTAAGGMATDTSEDIRMTPAGSKRRHQAIASAQDSHYEIDDDDMIESDDGSDDHSIIHPRNSPKKPRTSGPTSSGPKPSDITDKFCSHVVENVPFLPDPIHSQLSKLSIEQLIIPVREYIAQNSEIADTNVEHWRACAGQAAGTEMEQEMACTHCADHMEDGYVPFASCVVIDAAIPAGEHFKGACMNCVFLGKDQDCSLRRVESEENDAQ